MNHPLTIGGTEVFLIGHGYAPIITVRDGNGDVAYSGPTVFLPEDSGFRSFGVVPAYFAKPTPIGLEGLFFPTYINVNGEPANVMGDLLNPTLSMQAWVGDLGPGRRQSGSVYDLDTSKATKVTEAGRLDVPRRPPAGAEHRPARRRGLGDVRGRATAGPACRSAARPACTWPWAAWWPR